LQCFSILSFDYFKIDDEPYGKSFGWWTTKWWQWLLSKSRNYSPAIDITGKNNIIDQDQEHVWFLAGTFDNMDIAHREIQIPSGISILIPAICYQANFIEDPIFTNEKDLENHVRNDIDDIIEHVITVNEISIPTYRVISDPVVFPVTISKDIPHGSHSKFMDKDWFKNNKTMAVSDGYWAFIKPLPVGTHNLHLKGSCSGGIRRNEVYYKITVLN
jgi:hypothetical protein